MQGSRHPIGKFLAVAVVAGHLLAVAMALCPALHEWLHHDANESGHHCAATVIINGQLDRPEVAAVQVTKAQLFVTESGLLDPSQPLRAALRTTPGERAPPLA
ncbi:MAG TPA: hypothetical protein VIM48_04370 [Chthoniobacterales bacterium]